MVWYHKKMASCKGTCDKRYFAEFNPEANLVDFLKYSVLVVWPQTLLHRESKSVQPVYKGSVGASVGKK